MIEKLVREAHEKGGFSGAWLYAEKGEIVPKGAIGINDPEKGTPIAEEMVFDPASVTRQFRIRKRQFKPWRIYRQKADVPSEE